SLNKIAASHCLLQGSGPRHRRLAITLITAGKSDWRNRAQGQFCAAASLSCPCRLWVIHVIPAIRACPVRPKSGLALPIGVNAKLPPEIAAALREAALQIDDRLDGLHHRKDAPYAGLSFWTTRSEGLRLLSLEGGGGGGCEVGTMPTSFRRAQHSLRISSRT